MSTTYGEIETPDGAIIIEKYMNGVRLESKDGESKVAIYDANELKKLIDALDLAGNDIWRGWVMEDNQQRWEDEGEAP